MQAPIDIGPGLELDGVGAGLEARALITGGARANGLAFARRALVAGGDEGMSPRGLAERYIGNS